MKVVCKLDNASELINGVKFTRQGGDDGDAFMVSEDINPEVASTFLAIKGYEQLGDSNTAKPPTKVKQVAPAAA